jgi:NADH-quinone oxidoreductase subunit M
LIAIIFIIAGLASLGLPLTSGFAAEFLVFVGSFASTTVAGIKVFTLVSAIAVVLAAGYILWTVQRVFYGPALERYNGIKDADKLEMVYMFIFVGLILAVGIYPSMLTNIMNMGISPLTKILIP